MNHPDAIHSMTPQPTMPRALSLFPSNPHFSLKDRDNHCVEDNVEKTHTHSRSMTAAGILIACSALTMFLAGAPGASQPETIRQATKEGTKQAIQSWGFDVFPLAGAMLAAAGICLLHNVGEGKGKIAGRVVFALIGGFVAPWFVEMLPLTWKIADPRGQLVIGVAAGSVGYIFSRYVVEIVFNRAFGISEKIVDAGERELGKKLGEEYELNSQTQKHTD